MRRFLACLTVACVIVPALLWASPAPEAPSRVKILFLGDKGHHQPAKRAAEILPPLAKAGIDLAYTDDLADLNPSNLARYDALVIYANHERIAPEQEQALLDFVEGGKGLVVLHCGSYCFLNSPKYIAMVGGQFQRHETGTFTAAIDKPDHPALKGVEPFEAFDETYVHTKLSDDRTVLMHRDDNGRPEPWTWVRTQGKGRVFYTASGHDERVFTHPGYHKLVIAGIRWAADKGDGFAAAALAYKDSGTAIPNYVPSKKWGVQGEPHRKMQEPLSPAESMTHLSVPGGFRVELFAAEPDIFKPICLSWDDRGRLWVAETVDYPNAKQPEGQGHDDIKICEDTDGDGKADKFTVFADKLSIPTSMVHVPGGLIVTQAPDVLFLADTDGDDRADVRKVLFTGFHTDDTHAGPSNLRLGFDGWIYATVGYAGFEGTVGGKHFQFRQNLFRFKPDGSDLEVLTSTSNNTWGLGISEGNEVVYSTANGEHSSYLGQPNRSFEAVRGWLGRGNARLADHDAMHPATTIRQVDWFGGFTAAAGHALYTARQFPPEYWDHVAFICEPTGHVVHMDRLDRQGSHLVGRDRFNLLASTDEWTAPIVAEVGPDGAVWVLDWYNYIVQHNPTPLGFQTGKGNAYETPLRDKTHGRVYRIINEGPALGQVLDLTRATASDLVNTLGNDNLLWRMKAQWLLVARGDRSVVPALAKRVASHVHDQATGRWPATLHGLWALHGLGATGEPSVREAVVSALRHPTDGAIRRAAAEVLPRDETAAKAILDANLLGDADPVTRREALRVLGECPSSDAAGGAVYAMLARPENARDRWIPLAATTAAARHAAGFLAAALEAQDQPEAATRAVRIVAEHVARGGDTRTVGALVARLDKASPETVNALLAGLAAGWPAGKTLDLDADARAKLVALMERLDSAGQLNLALLAGRWGLGEKLAEAMGQLRASLAEQVADEGRAESARIAAARRLAQFDPDREALDGVLGAITPRVAPTLASGLLDAVGQSSSSNVAPALLGRWEQFTPALRRQAIDVLLKRPEWTRVLVEALDAGTLAANDLSVDQAQRLVEYPNTDLAAKAKTIIDRGGRLPSPDREKVLVALLPLCEKTGNAERGREVFSKTCAKCHRHGDLGEQIGPDLTGFAIHPKEKILTEVIDPNRSVEGNFRQYTVATSDGTVLSGLLASETRTAIELVDSEAKRHVVLRDDIDEMIASPKSLMPEGFETQLSPDEIVDLLEFLAAKGKFVPLPIDKAATVVSTKGMFYSEDAPTERLIFPDWAPKTAFDVPFQLIDPRDGRLPNVVVLQSDSGPLTKGLPKSVRVPCNMPARAIHILGGVAGWGFPFSQDKSVSMIVRLHYADGQTEDHPLRNGEQIADYIRRVDVPGSQLAFNLGGRQVRYLAVEPKRDAPIAEIEFLKGDDATAPIVVAVTAEAR
jgi:putative membrane-bound dehydrogenase-like protein